MHTITRVTTVAGIAVLAGVLALAARAQPAAELTFLAIDGRTNATPWIASAGPFVAVAWGASTGGRTDVFVAVSRDAGRTFGAPVRVNAEPGEARLGGELPPRVALQAAGPSTDPEIVVLWNARGQTTAIKASRSRDGGRTFEAALALQAPDAPGDRGWPSLAVDTRGTAHALWLDHRGLAADKARGAAGHHHAAAGAASDGVAMALKSGLYYAGVRKPPAEQELAKGVCYCCKTAFAAGPGGALYAAWRHVYPGNIRDIAFLASRDAGRTFSPPVRVSEDGWQIAGCPDDGPALAVDGQGTVHLVWPTVIGGPEPEGALFYATTADGRAFTPRVRVPTLGGAKPGRPQIAVRPGGRVAIAWDELRDGRRLVAVRELRGHERRKPAFGEVVVLADGAGAYPVLAALPDGVIAAWTSGPPESSRIAVRRMGELPGS